MPLKKLFPTQIFVQDLLKKDSSLLKELHKESYKIRNHDVAGQQWSKKNYPGGYTSYGSLSELHKFSSTFEQLKKRLDGAVKKYAQSLEMDLKNHKLEITNLWINIMPPKVYHGLHLHPLSSISGTIYLKVPKHSGGLKFEDPRMTCFMGSVPRLPDASDENRRFINIDPRPGQVLLFESWLRHEVTQNLSGEDRLSLSFNYNWF